MSGTDIGYAATRLLCDVRSTPRDSPMTTARQRIGCLVLANRVHGTELSRMSGTELSGMAGARLSRMAGTKLRRILVQLNTLRPTPPTTAPIEEVP
eukprot:1235255-Rhodomonas_salina.2